MARGQSGVRQPTLEQRREGGKGGWGKDVPDSRSGSGALGREVSWREVRRDQMVWAL